MDSVRRLLDLNMRDTLLQSAFVQQARLRPPDVSALTDAPRPVAWVFNFEEAFDDVSYTGQDSRTLHYSLTCTFGYDTASEDDWSVQADALQSNLEVLFRLDPRRAGLAYDTRLESAARLNLSDVGAGLGAIVMIWLVDYMVASLDPFTPMGG